MGESYLERLRQIEARHLAARPIPEGEGRSGHRASNRRAGHQPPVPHCAISAKSAESLPPGDMIDADAECPSEPHCARSAKSAESPLWWERPPWNGQISDEEFHAVIALYIARCGFYTPALPDQRPEVLACYLASRRPSAGPAAPHGG
jgi:hypothetical protein